MKALVCQEPHKIEYVERSIPTITEKEVLLKINAVGICGTDIHAYTGRQPFFSYPRVLGHEVCGTVQQVGWKNDTANNNDKMNTKDEHRIKRIKVGDRACVIPCVPCGTCAACKVNKTNCCERVSLYGVHQDGGFSEYLAVLESNLVKIPDSIPNSAGALIECFAIGAHAVRRAEIKAHENVLQIGAGPIGIATAAIAKSTGANVVVADVSLERRKHVEEKLGLKTIDPTDENYIEQLKSYFGGELACLVMDATGNKASMTNAVNLIRHGGKLLFIGLYIGDLIIDDPTFHKKESTLLSSRNATREDFEKVISLFESGLLSESLMKNKEYDFYTFGNNYQQAVVDNKELIKGVILF